MLAVPTILIKSHNGIFSAQMLQFLQDQRLGARVIADEDVSYDILITDSEDFVDPETETLLFLEKDVFYDFDAMEDLHATLYKKGGFNKMTLIESLKKSVEKIVLRSEETNFEREYVRENTVLRAAQEERDKDISNIKDFQASLYTSPSCPMAHFKSFVVYRPEKNSGVSGDVMFFRETPGKFYAMLADVTNHGLLAGYYGMALYTSAEAFVESSSPKDQNVTEWARWMIRAAALSRPRKHVKYESMLSATVTLVVVDIEKNEAQALLFGSGQEPPLLLSKNKAEVFPGFDQAIAPPLSPTIPMHIPQPATIPFEYGDMLIMYSDGLTELFAGESKFSKSYSNTRILSKITSIASIEQQLGAKKIALSILDDANSFTGNYSKKVQTKNDDLTLGCFKREDVQ